MGTIIKRTAILLLIGIVISAIVYKFWYVPKILPSKNRFVILSDKANGNLELLHKLKEVSLSTKEYCNNKSFNQQYCFLADMSIPSGKHRFFVYNMVKDSIELAGLVSHGIGSLTFGSELKFSNEPGSNCTSLGKYKIGKHYYGKFGLAYKLYGLEKSNSKAFERFVVLHSYHCVPADEVYPLPICPSKGCPMVSPAFMQKLKPYIDNSNKPVLLNIF